jgi:rSAM/selenodomain-associated transferase 1
MRRLALFARAPGGERSKTRLQPALPRACAASLYAACLADSLAVLAACVADERFVYWADDAAPASASIVSRSQRGETLGERLSAAFAGLLAGSSDRALILGSDAPALTERAVEDAFALLGRHDVVLGPAEDGGYWCVGLRQPAPELFRDVPWSTERVLGATMERARAAGLAVAMAATLADLDTPADLARLIGRLAAGERACGEHVRQALESLGLAPAR